MAYINLGQVIYPIGAYYFSDSSVSPATLFGGTWTAIEGGRFVCAANGTNWTAGEQGGHNWLTLTEAQMPKHTHYVKWSYTTGNAASGSGANYIPTQVTWDDNPNMKTNVAGASQQFDNKPEYRATYIWRRTA